MATWDDSQLVQMSNDREEILFPILNRSEGFLALLFVLALLPGFMALQQSEITPDHAEFALKSLSLFSTEPAVDNSLLPHALSGVTLLLPQFSLAQLLVLPSILCGFLITFALYLLGSRLLNPQCGLFAVLIFLFHPLWIEQLTFPVTPILTSALCLFCLWGYYRHLEQESLFSPFILISMVTAGLILLSIPMLSLMIFVGIFSEIILYALVKLIKPGLIKSSRKERALNSSIQFRLMSWSLLVAVVVSFGFMFEMLGANYRIGFMEDLKLFRQYIDNSGPDWLAWFYALWNAGAFQSNILLLGVAIAVRELIQDFSENSKNLVVVLLWSWMGLLWLVTFHAGLFPAELVQTFRLMFLSFSMLLMAIALEAVQLRKIGLRGLLVLMCLGLLISLGQPDRISSLSKSISQWLVVVMILFLAWRLVRYGSQQERFQRLVLQGSLILFFLFHSSAGWQSIQNNANLVEPYNQFQVQTQQYQDVDTCLVIGSTEDNSILQCLVATNWLGTEVVYIEDWPKGVKYLKSVSTESEKQILVLDTRQEMALGLDSVLPDWSLVSSSEIYQFPQFSLQCNLITH